MSVKIHPQSIVSQKARLCSGVEVGPFSIIEDNVTIYANATILGGETVIGKGAVIGANAWVTSPVAPNTRVTIKMQHDASVQNGE